VTINTSHYENWWGHTFPDVKKVKNARFNRGLEAMLKESFELEYLFLHIHDIFEMYRQIIV
jgi:hypothetical protein